MNDSSTDSHHLVRFGPYELDLGAGELRKSGVRLRLQQQPLQLLSVLVERPGDIVSREELRKRLWAEHTFVDFEHGLNAAVKRLRGTLGDTADSPRFIETVPRRGYRFIAPTDVAVGPVELNPSFGSRTATGAPVPVWRVKQFWLSVGAVIVFGGLWLYLSELRHAAPSGVAAVVPFTTFPGQEVAPTFSPDGSQIAFAWSPDGLWDQFDLYVKVIGSEKAHALTSHPADLIIPAWSPDGRQIAFARTAGERSGIYLVSPLGGDERKLSDWRLEYFLQAMVSWSPDGKFVAFHDKGPSGQFGISLVDVKTLKKEWHGIPATDCVWSWIPVFSPDGRSLAVVCMLSYGVNALFVVPASGGAGRRLAQVQGGFSGMTWTPDSESLLYALDGDLWRVADAGGEHEKLLSGRGIAMPAISRDGHRLAYTMQNAATINLWQVPLVARTRPAGPPVKLVASSQQHGCPSFSPDGRLAFNSNRSGAVEIWTSDADGSNATVLTAFGGPWTGSPRWSPDGRLIAFDSHGPERSRLYVVRSDGGPVTPVATGVDDSSRPAWSIDGKWLYFDGRTQGAEQVFKVPIEGGKATQLTTGGGSGPIFATSDGLRIYYTKRTEICSVSTSGRDERCLSALPVLRNEFSASWVLSPEGLYFIGFDVRRPGIDFYEFASGRIVRVVDLPGRPAPWGGPMALSPDGRQLLYSQADAIASDIMLIDNFADLARNLR